MKNEAVVEKIRKLLRLSKSANANEAAVAATRAAELMSKYNIQEASIRLEDGRAAEPIMECTVEQAKKRLAWKGSIASGLAHAFGGNMFWLGGNIMLLGRQQAIQSISYMYQYLIREIDRLADEDWARRKEQFPTTSRGTTWKHGFRLGAASVISRRLYEQRAEQVANRKAERAAVQEALAHTQNVGSEGVFQDCKALAVMDIIEKDEAEVTEAYAKRVKGGKSYQLRSTKSYSAWSAGREAGEKVNLVGGRGLNTPAAKLRS